MCSVYLVVRIGTCGAWQAPGLTLARESGPSRLSARGARVRRQRLEDVGRGRPQYIVVLRDAASTRMESHRGGTEAWAWWPRRPVGADPRAMSA
jgi:hypothetical protein